MYLIDGLLCIYVVIFTWFTQFVYWLPPVPPQCTVLQDITTIPVRIAVSAAQPGPTSLSLGRTTASLVLGTPPLTLMVPPMSPTAKVILLITFSILVFNWDSYPELLMTWKQASDEELYFQPLVLLFWNELQCKVFLLFCPQTSCVEVSWESTQATLSLLTTQEITHPMWIVSGPSTHHTRGGSSSWYLRSSSPSRMSVETCWWWGRAVNRYIFLELEMLAVSMKLHLRSQ